MACIMLYYISMKLTTAQQTAWNRILNHKTLNPDEAYRGDVYSPEKDFTSQVTSYTWFAKYVYGTFNTATLKALEKNGLIRLHEIGGAYNSDTIEIINH